ncbi:MAG: hypothetical protein IKV03_02940 [Alphaproteobacteria bacterium]|nr:hypothetical protein [Alphaproteobacteria bacterium]
MQKIICFTLGVLFLSSSVFADSRTLKGINENEQLGMMAGLALACNAGGKLDDYELIASRIIANTSQTNLEQKKAERQYAEAKFKAYKEHKASPKAGCGEILESFSNLPIFRSVVYADGSVKTPDGKMLKTRPEEKQARQQVKSKTPKKQTKKK